MLINPADPARLGFRDGEVVDIVGTDSTATRIARNSRLVGYPAPVGCAAAYYPEANALIAVDDHSLESGTPSFKSMPIELRRAEPKAP